ncbi:MAG: hypothetical protein R6U93_07555 [Dehalococcoidia bacterium]
MQLKNGQRTIAAITAAVAAYLDEEEQALLSATPRRRPAAVSDGWSSSGREEIMRMRTLWQRRIFPKPTSFGS